MVTSTFFDWPFLRGNFLLRFWLRKIFGDGGFQNSDIFYRTVVLVCLNLLDLIHDIHSFDDFAKDSILSVEMGRATDGLVHLDHLWCQFHGALSGRVKFLLDFRELLVLEDFSPDDIELTSR